MVKEIYLYTFICLNSFNAISQTDISITNHNSAESTSYKEWVNDLYEFGVKKTGDSIILSDKIRSVLNDSNSRKTIYPKVYNWPMTLALIKEMALKEGIWQLINLYSLDEANKEVVLKLIISLDQILEIDKALIASYYTYIGFDPEVYTIVAGKTTEVKRPDIAEKKLLATKEIVDHVIYYRKQFDNQNLKKGN